MNILKNLNKSFLILAVSYILMIIWMFSFLEKNNERKIASIDSTSCAYDSAISSMEAELNKISESQMSAEALIAEYQLNGSGQRRIIHTPYQSLWPIVSMNAMSEEDVSSYHQKVMELRSHFNESYNSTWSPAFNQYGDMINPIYGFGADTGAGIRSMYQNPTIANPMLGWSPTSLQMPESNAQLNHI